MKYRHRPVEIEALRFDGVTGRAIQAWAAAHGVQVEAGVGSHRGRAAEILRVFTPPAGMIVVGPGDWLIRDARGEFRTCPAGEFEADWDAFTPPRAAATPGGEQP